MHRERGFSERDGLRCGFSPEYQRVRVHGRSGWRTTPTMTAMGLANLTRPAVLAAIEEHDRLGRTEFLRRYGFGPARDYRLRFAGREYDSKAIAGVAHRFTSPGGEPLTAAKFSGGRETVKRTLERLGFV